MKNEYRRYKQGEVAKVEVSLGSKDREILNSFLQFCAMTAGKDRLDRYRRYLLQFRDVVEKPLDQVTRDDAIAFWALVNHSPYEEHTRIGIRKMVRRFLKWFYQDLEMIEPLKTPSSYFVNSKRLNKSVLLTEREIQLMLHQAERLRDKTLLVLLYETAARPQEIRDLRWKDIDWEREEIHLYSRKTDESRDLPVREALNHLKRWKAEWVCPDPQEKDFVFPGINQDGCDRSKSISVSYINRIVKRLARRAGIARNVYPYLIRHTRLTELHQSGVQGLAFSKFAGHRPGSAQDQVYVHMDNDDMKRAVIEKVYKVQELTRTERVQYEDRIDQLEKQFGEFLEFLTEFRDTISWVRRQYDPTD